MIQVRRSDGTYEAVRAPAEPASFARTKVGERIRVWVFFRAGSRIVRRSASARVRVGTRLERCLPVDHGAYPSYCAPENAPSVDAPGR